MKVQVILRSSEGLEHFRPYGKYNFPLVCNLGSYMEVREGSSDPRHACSHWEVFIPGPPTLVP